MRWRSTCSEARIDGTPLYEHGFWNLLARTLSPEAYSIARTMIGYDCLGSNANAVDLITEIYNFSPDVKCYLLNDGYEAVPWTLQQRFEAAGGRVESGAWMAGFTQTTFADGSTGVALHFRDGRPSVTARAIVLAMPRRSIELLDREGPVLDPAEAPHVPHLLNSGAADSALQAVSGLRVSVVERGGHGRFEAAAGAVARRYAGAPGVLLAGRSGRGEAADDGTGAADGLQRRDERRLLGGPERRRCDTSSPRRAAGAAARHFREDPAARADVRVRDRAGCARRRSQRAERNAARCDRPQEELGRAPRASPDGDGDASSDRADAQRARMRRRRSTRPTWTGRSTRSAAACTSGTAATSRGKCLEQMTKPVDDFPCYVCGEAYSTNQTWVEGALQTAEIMLQKHFGLAKPDWVTE